MTCSVSSALFPHERTAASDDQIQKGTALYAHIILWHTALMMLLLLHADMQMQ